MTLGIASGHRIRASPAGDIAIAATLSRLFPAPDPTQRSLDEEASDAARVAL